MSTELFLGETKVDTFKVVKHQNGRLYWTPTKSPSEFLVAVSFDIPHRDRVLLVARDYPEGTVVDMRYQCSVYMHGDE